MSKGVIGMTDDYLSLKFGTLKEWKFKSKELNDLVQKYFDMGATWEILGNKDTPEQKEVLIELIRKYHNDTVWNDWEDKRMTKEEAIEYIKNYDN